MIDDEKLQRLKMVCVSQKYLHRWDSLDGNAATPVEVLELISDVLKWRAAADKNSNEAASLRAEIWQWRNGITVDKCNRCGKPPPLMSFEIPKSGRFAFCRECFVAHVKAYAIEEILPESVKKSGIEIVEAGVDPSHQTHHCDDCDLVFVKDHDDQEHEMILTCSGNRYLTLCRQCYNKRGNQVR